MSYTIYYKNLRKIDIIKPLTIFPTETLTFEFKDNFIIFYHALDGLPGGLMINKKVAMYSTENISKIIHNYDIPDTKQELRIKKFNRVYNKPNWFKKTFNRK